MRRADFLYALPTELIAQHPPAQRGESRMLCLDRANGLADRAIREFPAQLRPGDLVVFNDTRVIPARLSGVKASGGRVEILIERVLDGRHVLAQVRASKALRSGGEIRVDGIEGAFAVEGREGEFYRLRWSGAETVLQVLERAGQVPLPPYIRRANRGADEREDRERYQTIFARAPGAVAAPTAGLHFDQALLAAILARGAQIQTLTLHVGAGTFQPLRVDDIGTHRMHAERYEIPPALAEAWTQTRVRGGRVVAIGTTSLRALESAATDDGALCLGAGETRLFITPGYRFKAVDALLTNFHLPESTLLMLVCAFAGHAPVMAAYAHAVRERYRFFSYGDAMWIPSRAEPGASGAVNPVAGNSTG